MKNNSNIIIGFPISFKYGEMKKYKSGVVLKENGEGIVIQTEKAELNLTYKNLGSSSFKPIDLICLL